MNYKKRAQLRRNKYTHSIDNSNVYSCKRSEALGPLKN